MSNLIDKIKEHAEYMVAQLELQAEAAETELDKLSEDHPNWDVSLGYGVDQSYKEI